jgi:MFS family permease
VIARYRQLFSTPGYLRLLLSSILGRLPSGMFSLAILFLVHQQTGSFLSAGLAVGVFTLTGAALSPLWGRLVDRYGQARVLLPSAVGQSLLLVVLVGAVQAGAPLAAILFVCGCAGALLPPVSGCVRALWAEVVRDPDALETCYSLDAVTQESIYTLGPLLAGSVAVLVSPAASILLCAAIALGGTILFASCPPSRDWRGESREGTVGGALASSALRSLLTSAVFGGVVVGAIEVGLPALSVSLGSRGSAGVLLALFSIGSMAGGIAYSAHTAKAPKGNRYAVVLLAVEILVIPLVLVGSLAAALLFSVVAGLGIAPMLSCQFSLVGALAPDGTTTEAFSWHRGTTVAGIALGSALGGSLVAALGASGPFALAGTGAAIACVLASLGWRRIEPRRDPRSSRQAAGADAPGTGVTGAGYA